ncbi:MAG TPA: UvrD-helicase domain-containing protein [Candidatus Ignatzschineria merdigallinarum]|uniref:UvrD-helicase domain-containing protein n=1 Tax=Candidatus Ignatzschineria merdigallinarum TaxID=2838621 RepID=A0A9D1TV92_9GAMM|nr:UvrD-helicase domain-containing protein [Candidatus Ignatzschineria merdigallinarum]
MLENGVDQQSDYQILEPQTVPIAGNMMIEASAGTGKTYTITLLVLRLLLGLNPDQTPKKLPEILIVTFTNAATAELKERIYSRIVDLKQAFFSFLMDYPVEDEALLQLIERYLMQAETNAIAQDAALETAINLLNQA